MTLPELRKKINESGNHDSLSQLEVTVTYPYINFSEKFVGLSKMYAFIIGEVKKWNEYEDLPDQLLGSKKHFEELKDALINIMPYIEDIDDGRFQQTWQQLNSRMTSETSSYRGYRVFVSNSPETKYLIGISKESPDEFNGAYDYLLSSTSYLDYNYFKGMIKSYEFQYQDSDILKRRTVEKAALSKIRQEFLAHVNEAEGQLNEYLNNTKQNLLEHFENADKTKEENNKNYHDWYNGVVRDFESFYEGSQSSIIDFEDTYKLKLKLEAPAEYWKQRAKKLKEEGNKWAIYLFVAVFIAASSLFLLLWQIPDGMFLKLFKGEASAIKWTIVYITYISFIAYSIKILAKMTFSTYHLSRDSEEREQLSYFYLALKKDSDVTDEERQLILQSLFSRSDTGLLKEDSSPTMPSNIIEKHFNK